MLDNLFENVTTLFGNLTFCFVDIFAALLLSGLSQWCVYCSCTEKQILKSVFSFFTFAVMSCFPMYFTMSRALSISHTLNFFFSCVSMLSTFLKSRGFFYLSCWELLLILCSHYSNVYAIYIKFNVISRFDAWMPTSTLLQFYKQFLSSSTACRILLSVELVTYTLFREVDTHTPLVFSLSEVTEQRHVSADVTHRQK